MSTRTRRQEFSGAICSAKIGFSLIEVLFVLAITAILAGLASPTISSWIEAAQAKAIQQQLSSLLFDARYLALSSAQILTVCHLEGDQCSSNLAFPLSAFIDPNRDAVRDANETLLREASADIPSSAQLNWNRSGVFLRFWPSGGTGALSGSVTYCDVNSPDNNFRIVVARTGRLRIDKNDTRCN
jgi:type IV fimbrial biogenesis protein FimT